MLLSFRDSLIGQKGGKRGAKKFSEFYFPGPPLYESTKNKKYGSSSFRDTTGVGKMAAKNGQSQIFPRLIWVTCLRICKKNIPSLPPSGKSNEVAGKSSMWNKIFSWKPDSINLLFQMTFFCHKLFCMKKLNIFVIIYVNSGAILRKVLLRRRPADESKSNMNEWLTLSFNLKFHLNKVQFRIIRYLLIMIYLLH